MASVLRSAGRERACRPGRADARDHAGRAVVEPCQLVRRLAVHRRRRPRVPRRDRADRGSCRACRPPLLDHAPPRCSHRRRLLDGRLRSAAVGAGPPAVVRSGDRAQPGGVYVPLPPRDSTTRSSGAYGRGRRRFDADRYRELSYDALLGAIEPACPVEVFVAAGDDEYVHPDPRDARHDMPIEVARLHSRLSRAAGVSSHLRVFGGGHDRSIWWPALLDGLRTVAIPPSRSPRHDACPTDKLI